LPDESRLRKKKPDFPWVAAQNHPLGVAAKPRGFGDGVAHHPEKKPAIYSPAFFWSKELRFN
jgi:hypothetical protein